MASGQVVSEGVDVQEGCEGTRIVLCLSSALCHVFFLSPAVSCSLDRTAFHVDEERACVHVCEAVLDL